MALTVVQARNDLLSILGYLDVADAPAQALQDIAVALSGAMQMLQTAGEEFFTEELLTVNLGAGTAIYSVDRGVQAVVGPALLNGVQPLSGLDSKGEYDQFDRIYLGLQGFGAQVGTPMAYWVQNTRSGTTGDINRIQLFLAPTPLSDGFVTMYVIYEAPSYDVSDLTSTDELPVAQNYTESIFLPIARMLVTRSALFSRPDILGQLQGDAGTAYQRLGFNGGFPNAEQPLPERKTEG